MTMTKTKKRSKRKAQAAPEKLGVTVNSPRGWKPGKPIQSAEGCMYPTWERVNANRNLADEAYREHAESIALCIDEPTDVPVA